MSNQHWRAAAACFGMDADTFFPEGPKDYVRMATAEAKAICADCPVVTECGNWALDARIEHGVYGGLDERERKSLLRQAGEIKQRGPGRAKAPCGTRAAYDRHIRNGEAVDNLCATEGRYAKPLAGADLPPAEAAA